MQKQLISKSIEQNENMIKTAFFKCDDLKMRKLQIGKNSKVTGFVCYIEVNLHPVFKGRTRYVSTEIRTYS